MESTLHYATLSTTLHSPLRYATLSTMQRFQLSSPLSSLYATLSVRYALPHAPSYALPHAPRYALPHAPSYALHMLRSPISSPMNSAHATVSLNSPHAELSACYTLQSSPLNSPHATLCKALMRNSPHATLCKALHLTLRMLHSAKLSA